MRKGLAAKTHKRRKDRLAIPTYFVALAPRKGFGVNLFAAILAVTAARA